MKFVKISPPEAGRLDEHKAVVELTADDLERLRRWRRGQAVNVPGHADYEMAEVLVVAEKQLSQRIEQAAPAPKTPCIEGFHWIGQSFATCDECGLPAWEHAGMARPAGGSPFSNALRLEPWKPGEAEACRRKWDPNYVAASSAREDV